MVFGGVIYTTELPARINNILLHTNFTLMQDKRLSANEREIT
ncbi:MAG: hypothetical protein ACE5HS_12655 [bacterium]